MGQSTWQVLGVFVVGEPVKQVQHDLKHGLEKAYFVTRHATKDTKSLHLHLLRPLLLELNAILPCRVRLVPVIRRQAGKRRVGRFEGSMDGGIGKRRVDRVAASMVLWV